MPFSEPKQIVSPLDVLAVQPHIFQIHTVEKTYLSSIENLKQAVRMLPKLRLTGVPLSIFSNTNYIGITEAILHYKEAHRVLFTTRNNLEMCVLCGTQMTVVPQTCDMGCTPYRGCYYCFWQPKFCSEKCLHTYNKIPFPDDDVDRLTYRLCKLIIKQLSTFGTLVR